MKPVPPKTVPRAEPVPETRTYSPPVSRPSTPKPPEPHYRKEYVGDKFRVALDKIHTIDKEDFSRDEIYVILNVEIYDGKRSLVNEYTYRWPEKAPESLGNGERVTRDKLPAYEVTAPTGGRINVDFVLMERDVYSDSIWIEYTNYIAKSLGYGSYFVTNPYTSVLMRGSSYLLRALTGMVRISDFFDKDDQLGRGSVSATSDHTGYQEFHFRGTNNFNKYHYVVEMVARHVAPIYKNTRVW